MPGSYSIGKKEIINFIKQNFDSKTRILDVGPGYGTYGKHLNDKYEIDCVEIFPKYIDDYELNKIYKNIFISDICDFDFNNYDLLIIGDVLEHITVDRAISLINKINTLNKKVMVAVPYQYEQGEWGGNIYETHHQPDLTPNIMSERYPSLKIYFDYPEYGYYFNF
jgi:16S rRNA A1518/A1519 N6-dimethyltransferase RsmA/KsgA/DIM1 with predicted DNA glycosylase/AP lyase activity